jgi:hypothetical protein
MAATARLPLDRHFETGAVLMLVLLGLGIAGQLTDPRLLDGWNVWTKPVKFAASLALHLATLAFFASRLSFPFRTGPVMAVTVTLVLASAAAEMAYLIAQAGQQEHSHFNLATPYHRVMYGLMGVGAVLLTAAAAVIGLLILRDPGARLGPGLRRGAVLGLAGGFVLTLVVAGYMSSGTGHHVGLAPPGAPELPLLGWSLAVGDLRPAHFLALHMMQAIPLLGWALDHWLPDRAVAWTTGAALVWAALTLAVFAQALAGLPLLAP